MSYSVWSSEYNQSSCLSVGGKIVSWVRAMFLWLSHWRKWIPPQQVLISNDHYGRVRPSYTRPHPRWDIDFVWSNCALKLGAGDQLLSVRFESFSTGENFSCLCKFGQVTGAIECQSQMSSQGSEERPQPSYDSKGLRANKIK